MLKHFVLAASAAALVLAGCTKVETVDVADQNLISFGDSFIGNPTKAVEEVTTESIDRFYAYGGYSASGQGADIFDQQLVEKAANGEWVYSDLEKWVDGQTYRFVAYSLPEEMTTKGTPDFDYDGGKLTITNYVVDKDNFDEDLLVSDLRTHDLGDADSDRSLVKFTFGHALSWIVFDLASGFDSKYTVTITKAKFYNMLSKRTYETNAWTGVATEAILEGNAMVIPTTGMSGAGEGTDNLEKITSGTTPVNGKLNFYVIPQAIPSSVTLEIAATVSDGADFNEKINLTATIPIDAVSTWDMGFKYTYKATITGTDTFITFDAPEVNEWQGKNNGIDLGDL